MRLGWKVFIIVNASLLALLLLFPVYLFAVSLLPEFMTGCTMHDFMHIYCPVCGGTRAVSSLLHFNLLQALRENAGVVLLFFVFLGYDIAAFVRLIQKKKVIVKFPLWFLISLPSVLVAWYVLRIALLVFWGIDPTGDLGAFWR